MVQAIVGATGKNCGALIGLMSKFTDARAQVSHLMVRRPRNAAAFL